VSIEWRTSKKKKFGGTFFVFDAIVNRGCRHLVPKKRKFVTSVCVRSVDDVYVILCHREWINFSVKTKEGELCASVVVSTIGAGAALKLLFARDGFTTVHVLRGASRAFLVGSGLARVRYILFSICR
jgi:hypothetical protein